MYMLHCNFKQVSVQVYPELYSRDLGMLGSAYIFVCVPRMSVFILNVDMLSKCICYIAILSGS